MFGYSSLFRVSGFGFSRRNMSCPSSQDLGRLLAEALIGLERDRVEAHVEGCGACQETLEGLTAVAFGPVQSSARDDTTWDRRPLAVSPPSFLDELAKGPGSGVSDQRYLTPHASPLTRSSVQPSLPGYEILEVLGRGGMGVVYKARQKHARRVVALKMVLAGTQAGADELGRFRNEIEAVARLHHPHIVQIYEVGEREQRPFFSMEFADAGTLAQKLKGTPVPVRRAAQLVETLAHAVHHAHQHGIVHRDLKRANVLLLSDGVVSGGVARENDPNQPGTAHHSPLTHQPKIADFGLAKILTSEPGMSAPDGRTQTGAVLGTPSYMSPEQASGRSKEIGPASDIYSLGAILYEMLTGRPPFRGESSLETLQQVLSDDPVPPRVLQPKVPRDLETVCLKCLEKESRRRYADAEALAEDLRRFQAGEPVLARPALLWERGWKWARRRPVAAVALAISGLAGACLLTGWMMFTVQIEAARDRADENAARFQQQKEQAEKEWHRAETNYARALEAVDRLLTRVGESKLAGVPEMDRVRQDLLQEALRHCQAFLRDKDTPTRASGVKRASPTSARLGSRTCWGNASRPAKISGKLSPCSSSWSQNSRTNRSIARIWLKAITTSGCTGTMTPKRRKRIVRLSTSKNNWSVRRNRSRNIEPVWPKHL
jgi:serine/threonine protein kinase